MLFEYDNDYELYMGIYRHGMIFVLIGIDVFMNKSNVGFLSLLYTAVFVVCYSTLHVIIVQIGDHEVYSTDQKWTSVTNCKKKIFNFS